MNLDETLSAVEAGNGPGPVTISYAESVAAFVPSPPFDLPDPTEDELASARTALRKRDWIDEEGKPTGLLLAFNRLLMRPGSRSWFWESSRGTAIMFLPNGRDAAGLAIPEPDHEGVFTVSLQRVEPLVRHIAADAWQTSKTSLFATDLSGSILPLTLDRTGKKPTLTAPRSLDQPPIGRGMRHKIPMSRRAVDQAGFAQAVATALDNVLWGLDDENRALALSLS